MIYLLNTHLSHKKKVDQALQDIYGLGKHTSFQICDFVGLSSLVRLKQLSSVQLEQLTQMISKNYSIGTELKRDHSQKISRLIHIASYRGFRHTQGLPVRGQRTHTNSRTVRKLKKKV